MPISAAGNLKRAPRDAGFSLVEAMVTLVIIGLMASTVMLLAPSPDRETRALAEHFASRIAVASEEAIVVNRPMALVMTREGYGFARLDERGWMRVVDGSALAFRAWPDGVEYRVAEAADTETETERVVRFDAMGQATPARIVLTRAGSEWEITVNSEGRAHVSPRE